MGSAGEEAAKLLGALADWARDGAAEIGAHLATDDPECRYCPICRTVHAIRAANPEVRTQLAGAAASFLQAAAGLLTAAVAPGGESSAGRSPSVQRIDLDVDPDAEQEDGQP